MAEPARAPYDAYVAGAGLVEASTENIGISTPVPGLVTQVRVKVGAGGYEQTIWPFQPSGI